MIKSHPHLVFKLPCTWNVQLGDNTRSAVCIDLSSFLVCPLASELLFILSFLQFWPKGNTQLVCLQPTGILGSVSLSLKSHLRRENNEELCARTSCDISLIFDVKIFMYTFSFFKLSDIFFPACRHVTRMFLN